MTIRNDNRHYIFTASTIALAYSLVLMGKVPANNFFMLLGVLVGGQYGVLVQPSRDESAPPEGEEYK
jgi:hypothetical protein